MSGTGVSGALRAELRRIVRSESRRAPQREVLALLAALAERMPHRILGAIYYGSCRRQTRIEGLVDLHMIVDDAALALGSRDGWLCRLLPPNVYYLETTLDDGTEVRCKYAVLTRAQFQRACTRRAFHSYFWARYAQPVSLVGVRDVEREGLEESLVDAIVTLFTRSLARLPDVDDPEDLWVETLRLCYGAELRPEGRDRARELVRLEAAYHHATAAAMLAERDAILAHGDPRLARVAWPLRTILGKPLSLARLLKALATFDGGLDYAVWKLERHTGRRVELDDRVRRAPLLYIWPVLLRLWRDGVFR